MSKNKRTATTLPPAPGEELSIKGILAQLERMGPIEPMVYPRRNDESPTIRPDKAPANDFDLQCDATPDDLRVMALALDAWNGKPVKMTAEEWARAEKLLEAA